MQLQQLKLESESYAEGPMLISSDEDAGDGSILNEKGVCKTEEGWEPSYIVDVLTGSGFNDADADANPDMFMGAWHSPECPVDPLVFEEVEKKYCDQTSCPRYERRLLFDRINSALLEIYQQFMHPHPWIRGRLQDRLCALLAGQEKKCNKDSLGKVLASESQWLALGDEVDVMSGEIERSLTDEVVAEVVAMLGI